MPIEFEDRRKEERRKKEEGDRLPKAATHYVCGAVRPKGEGSATKKEGESLRGKGDRITLLNPTTNY